MAALVQDSIGWRWCFYIQAKMILPGGFGILIIPKKYMDLKNTGKLIRDYQLEKANNKRLKRTSITVEKVNEESLRNNLQAREV